MNLIEYQEAAIPYFPLKRADGDNRVIIGRSFFQEAYLITNYETSTFSVHKAKFPENPLRDTSIKTIAASDNSPYPGPPPRPSNASGLSQSQIVGLAIGISFLGIAAAIAYLILRRRKKRQQRAAENTDEPFKDKASTIESSTPTTPLGRIVSKMSKSFPMRRATKGSTSEEHEEKENELFEFAADSSHERYELPGPDPVELEATDAGRRRGRRASGYHYAKRQSEQQQQRMAPQYSSGAAEPPVKAYYNINPATQQYEQSNQILESPSPISSHTYDTSSNNFPSPLSSQGDWTNRIPDGYSPMGFVPTQTLSHSTSNPNFTYASSSPSGSSIPEPGTLDRSASITGFGTGHLSTPQPPPATFQRTPIDASRVICLGPLPEDVHFPCPSSAPPTPGLLHLNGQTIVYPPMPPIPCSGEGSEECSRMSRRVSTADTLGSNYTVEEEARLAVARETVALSRIDGGDIIHIPQPASQRYSWEER